MSLAVERAPEGLLRQIDWNTETRFDPEDVGFIHRLGVLAIRGVNGVHVIGFHADAEQDRPEIVPAITLRQRPESSQTLNHNAKGIGIVLGNQATVVLRPSEAARKGRDLGVWITPDLEEADIVDARFQAPTLVAVTMGLARHANLMQMAKRHAQQAREQGLDPHEAKLQGIEIALQSIEEEYGQAALAIINPAPRWLGRQVVHRIHHEVRPAWLVYRHRERLPIIRVGRAIIPGAQPHNDRHHASIATVPRDQRIAAAQSLGN